MTLDVGALVDAARLDRVAPGLVAVAVGPLSVRVRLTADGDRLRLVAELPLPAGHAPDADRLRIESLESAGDTWVATEGGSLLVGRHLLDPTPGALHDACHEAAKVLAALVGGGGILDAAGLEDTVMTSPVAQASPFEADDPGLAQVRAAAASSGRTVGAVGPAPGWTRGDLATPPDTQLVPGVVYRVLGEDQTTTELLGPDGRVVFARRGDVVPAAPTG